METRNKKLSRAAKACIKAATVYGEQCHGELSAAARAELRNVCRDFTDICASEHISPVEVLAVWATTYYNN